MGRALDRRLYGILPGVVLWLDRRGHWKALALCECLVWVWSYSVSFDASDFVGVLAKSAAVGLASFAIVFSVSAHRQG